MIKNHHLTPKLEESLYFKNRDFYFCKIYLIVKNRRRRQFPLPPLFTLHSTNCLIINLHQIRTTFQWSHSIESLSSIELIYHINSKESLIFIHLSIKQSQTLIELFSINIYLKYDSIREFYFVNLYDYFLKINNENLIIEIILNNQTCQTSYGYLIISSLKSNQIFSNDPQQITKCKLKTIQIKFEELGLADLIIRPKEYPFTYCDGSCLNFLSQQHSSIHTFLQSIIRKKNSNIPQLNCVPSQYSDDNFLLRQTDGNMEIYPIKNAIVKQCACL